MMTAIGLPAHLVHCIANVLDECPAVELPAPLALQALHQGVGSTATFHYGYKDPVLVGLRQQQTCKCQQQGLLSAAKKVTYAQHAGAITVTGGPHNAPHHLTQRASAACSASQESRRHKKHCDSDSPNTDTDAA